MPFQTLSPAEQQAQHEAAKAAAPKCATVQQHQLAVQACQRLQVRGLGAAPATWEDITNPFRGVSPCYVAELPICAPLQWTPMTVRQDDGGDDVTWTPTVPTDDEKDGGFSAGGAVTIAGLLLLVAAGGYGIYRYTRSR